MDQNQKNMTQKCLKQGGGWELIKRTGTDLVYQINLNCSNLYCINKSIFQMGQVREFDNFPLVGSFTTQNSLEKENKQRKNQKLYDRQKYKTILKTGKWIGSEQLKYLEFIQSEMSSLSSKQERRSAKIFKKMSQFIQTRGPDQCRSHHQKMQKKYDTIANIILNCHKSLSKSEIQFQESISCQSKTEIQNFIGNRVLKLDSDIENITFDLLSQKMQEPQPIFSNFQNQKCHYELESVSIFQLLNDHQSQLTRFAWQNINY